MSYTIQKRALGRKAPAGTGAGGLSPQVRVLTGIYTGAPLLLQS